MRCYKASFDGELLTRGFWFYIYVIKQLDEKIIYVGRTGDSSSLHASSPFLRLTRHLDRRPTAKGATLLKQITNHGFDVEKCSFELFAFGPLYPEQLEKMMHCEYRDILAALERDVAVELKLRGCIVVGTHHSKAKGSPALLSQILAHENFIWKH